ncbi:unnamed protein product [Dracunculus medinensis]|uniref:Transcription factor n=1 Tax=Dracunculus medinensis TaxID=318479 RepID=A0A0N4U1G2_DRAME|nr:unnamed protein product [Dracunculus medinensis]
MYPTNWQPSSSSSSIDESVQQYWNNHHQNKILNSSTAAVTYDPLLYPQNYMKNMFGAAAAAVGQWVDSSNTFANYNSLQSSAAPTTTTTSHISVLPNDRSLQINQPVFPWMKMTGKTNFVLRFPNDSFMNESHAD